MADMFNMATGAGKNSKKKKCKENKGKQNW